MANGELERTKTLERAHTGIVDDMAGHLEFFHGDFAVPREEQDIPVLEPHREHEFDNAAGSSRRDIREERSGRTNQTQRRRAKERC
jgi:hypothetical protein